MPAATNDSSQPLVEVRDQEDPESTRRCNGPCTNCKIPVVLEKGTVVVLVWNTLVNIALFSQVVNGSVAITFMSLTFPIAGWIADTWIGRYRVLRTAMHLLLLSSSLGIPVHVALMYTSSEIVVGLSTVLTCFAAAGISCYTACFIQFATDQMIGASSDQLSFTIHWLMWGLGVGALINAVLNSVLRREQPVLVSQCLSFVTLLIACFVLWYWNDSLMTVPQISNPIKHIFRVLNYARKHKFPERRSALSYWEEDYPSRIDLGKDRYGGPFTVEEVEDVKTTLRLIPVVLCAAVANIGSWVTWDTLIWKEHIHSATINAEVKAVLKNSNNYGYGIVIGMVLFLFYHFFLSPFFHHHIPSMLKRVAAGILLSSVSYFLSAVLGTLQICSTAHHRNCIFHSAVFNMSENGLWWIVIPMATSSIGFLLVIVVLVEFIIAQTPLQVKGLMVGIMISSTIICGAVGWGIYSKAIPVILPMFPKQGITTWFYGNMFFSVIIFLAFILFVFISKWYRLRKRDDVVPYHMFAEDYFEKNYRREREYLKNTGYFGYGSAASSTFRTNDRIDTINY